MTKITKHPPMRLENHLNTARAFLTDVKSPELRACVEELITAILVAAGGEPSILNARRVIARALKGDPGFRESYLANIACCIMDFEAARHVEPAMPVGPMSTAQREMLADQILILLFES